MDRRYVKPSSLLLYVLAPLVFFPVGATIAGLSGAADGQGLAGGAIIFFYGLVAAAVAFIASFFYVGWFSRAVVVRTVWVLGAVALVSGGLVANRIRAQAKEHQRELDEMGPPSRTVAPEATVAVGEPVVTDPPSHTD